MSEYIISDEQIKQLFDTRPIAASQMERIIRCRDCKWFEALSSNGFPVLDKRGKQIIRCERECLSLPDDNGFCAWGERKQDDQLRVD